MNGAGGSGTVAAAGAAGALRERFRGDLLQPGDDGYQSARKIWNGAIDKRPALIARCTGVADVRAAVQFARERNLVVAVRGGATTSPARPYATKAS